MASEAPGVASAVHLSFSRVAQDVARRAEMEASIINIMHRLSKDTAMECSNQETSDGSNSLCKS
jgi:hypothetical protein